ncbi:MAG TPA: MFS transporter [Turneriella sp.]|nr:MFS transporter [Turneriella sp.]
MSWSKISLYALAESGAFAVEFFVRLQLLIFYTDTLGIDSSLASLAAGIGLFWDAFIDPFVGSYSDTFKSRWGNRKPFLIAGGILIIPSLYWIFSPSLSENTLLIFIQIAAANLILNTGITLVTVPHAAISAELSRDAKVRIRIFAARLIFANIGLILGLLVPAAILKWGREVGYTDSLIYPRIALVIALIAMATIVICVLSLGKSTTPNVHGHRSFIKDIKIALKNRLFIGLFVSGFIAYIAVAINSALARYYYEHFLHLREDEFVLVLIVFILVWSSSVVFWVKIADYFGKDRPATLGVIGLGLMSIVVYPLLPTGQLVGPILAAIVGGVFTGCIILFDSYVADVADLDRNKSGESREGLYFGVWKFGIKASRGIALVVAGFLLTAIDYHAGESPNQVVSFRIALLFGPGVGSVFVIAAIVFYFFVGKTIRTSNTIHS